MCGVFIPHATAAENIVMRAIKHVNWIGGEKEEEKGRWVCL